MVDCERELPSNKTLVAKLGLVRRSQPLLVFAGGGANPKQVPGSSAGSAYAINAWVKPKAEAKVHQISSQQSLAAVCAGRRPCLLSAMEADSSVLSQLAHKFRKLEVCAVGSDKEGKPLLSWGRGEEVGETLEEDEAMHLGQRVSFVKPDPEQRAGKGKQRESAPRLLRGFGGNEDLPSLSLFAERALAAEEEGFIRSPLPKVVVPAKKPKPVKARKEVNNDNVERQRKRARKLAEAAAKAEAEAEAKAKADEANKEEAQRLREQAARARMAAEEAAAGNLIEEVDDEDDEDDDEEEEEEVELDEDDDVALDLDN